MWLLYKFVSSNNYLDKFLEKQSSSSARLETLLAITQCASGIRQESIDVLVEVGGFVCFFTIARPFHIYFDEDDELKSREERPIGRRSWLSRT